MQFGAGEESVGVGGVRGGEGFAGEEHSPHRGEAFGVGCGGEECSEHGGHEVQDGDLVAVDDLGEIGRVFVAAVFRDDEGGADDGGEEEFPDRDVEDGGGFLQDPITGAESVVLGHPGEAVDDRLVGDHDAFGASGGAGGEQDICRVRRGQGPRQHRCHTFTACQTRRDRRSIEEITGDDHRR